VKPTLRWNIVGGLSFNAAVIYSQAIYAESTPSSTGPGAGNKALGIELDTGLRFDMDRFSAFLDYGLFQPMGAFDDSRVGAASISRAHALRSGLVVKF
jgi:hypothetical protein